MQDKTRVSVLACVVYLVRTQLQQVRWRFRFGKYVKDGFLMWMGMQIKDTLRYYMRLWHVNSLLHVYAQFVLVHCIHTYPPNSYMFPIYVRSCKYGDENDDDDHEDDDIGKHTLNVK